MSKQPLLAVCLLAALPLASVAQMTRGSFTGVVSDSSGAFVPGVSIKIRGIETGTERESISNESGTYRIIGIDPGAYRLEFQKAGFETYVVARVQLNTGAEITLNPTLTVGAAATVIEVTEPPVGVELSKSTATVERTFQSKFVNEIPLTGATRDVNTLARTSHKPSIRSKDRERCKRIGA
jgi:hypothetical protein